MMSIRFTPNDKGNPPNKLADAELRFEPVSPEARAALAAAPEGVALLSQLDKLAGMKLVGFAVWERAGGHRSVTFPARQYSINGERRSFALFRPFENPAAQDAIRDQILVEFAEFEAAGVVSK
ncbi:MAG: hypothetical protein AB7O67_23360 [Vicinamibacterales bacterium]